MVIGFFYFVNSNGLLMGLLFVINYMLNMSLSLNKIVIIYVVVFNFLINDIDIYKVV